MPLPFILAASVLANLTEKFSDWDSMSKWLKELVAAQNSEYKGAPHAAKVYGAYSSERDENLIQVKYKWWYKEKENWMEETKTATILADAVPEIILSKIKAANGEEVDITVEMEKNCKLKSVKSLRGRSLWRTNESSICAAYAAGRKRVSRRWASRSRENVRKRKAVGRMSGR